MSDKGIEFCPPAARSSRGHPRPGRSPRLCHWPLLLATCLLATAGVQATDVQPRGGSVGRTVTGEGDPMMADTLTNDGTMLHMTKTFTPPALWAFKTFDDGLTPAYVAFLVDPMWVPPNLANPAEFQEGASSICFALTKDTTDFDADEVPLEAQGNLQPPAGGGGGEPGQGFHWAAKTTVPPQNAIYHIIFPAAAARFGHSAAIIPNGTVVTYYSYGDGGGNLVTHQNFADIAAALAWAKGQGYTAEEHWFVTQDQARAACEAAWRFNNTQYNKDTNNCWHMVAAALTSAGVNFYNWPNNSPNFNFDQNIKKNTVDGYSSR